jgi:hypothetical protein
MKVVEAMDPEEPPQPGPPAPKHASQAWANVTLWIGLALVLAGGAVIILRSCLAVPERVLRKTGAAIDKTGEALATIAAAFRQGSIRTSFVSYATTLTNSQRLQFATLRQMEIFTRTEEPSTAFGYVPLPDVVVEARAPVEYTYYLDLNARWDFRLHDGVLEVFAPPIRANKPALDVSALTYEVKKGHFKTAEALDNLKSSISSLVILRAKDNIPLVRETGRHETEQFVERWLTRAFADGKQYPVKVYFPGESPPAQIRLEPRLSK